MPSSTVSSLAGNHYRSPAINMRSSSYSLVSLHPRGHKPRSGPVPEWLSAMGCADALVKCFKTCSFFGMPCYEESKTFWECYKEARVCCSLLCVMCNTHSS